MVAEAHPRKSSSSNIQRVAVDYDWLPAVAAGDDQVQRRGLGIRCFSAHLSDGISHPRVTLVIAGKRFPLKAERPRT